MKKNEHTKTYTAEQLSLMTGRSDWDKAAALTDAEIEAAVTSDADEAGMVVDWDSAKIVMPQNKAELHMRLDRDILDFFKRGGRGYQTKINAVLRAYVQQQQGPK